MRRESMMFLNVNYTIPQDNDSMCCNTPRTPEILNLLSGPFEKYLKEKVSPKSEDSVEDLKCSLEGISSSSYAISASTPGDSPMSPKENAMCPPTLKSPPPSAPPTLELATRMIAKASLQRTIITRMKAEGREELPEIKVKAEDKLTPEDEARRLKRRERNKVAATKCREKKKERTKMLVEEAGVLECQNMTLKTEIQKFEEEKHRLMEVLRVHNPLCTRPAKTKRPYYSPYPPTPVYTPTQPQVENFGCSFNPAPYPEYPQQYGGFYGINQFPEQPTPMVTPEQPINQFEPGQFNIQQIMSNLYSDTMP